MLPLSSFEKIGKLPLSVSSGFEKFLSKPLATFQEFFSSFLRYHLPNKFDWSDFVNDKKFKSVSDIDKNIISYKNKIFKIQRKIDSLLALNKNLDVDYSLVKLNIEFCRSFFFFRSKIFFNEPPSEIYRSCQIFQSHAVIVVNFFNKKLTLKNHI